ncbi:hypothetical protein JOM56_008201 [Amanita muscaria]
MSTSSAFCNVTSLLRTRTFHGRVSLRWSTYATLSKPVSPNGGTGAQKAKFNKNTVTAPAPRKPEREPMTNGPLKDEDIKYSRVRISHDGRLSAPATVTRLLSLIDRRGYYIQLVNQQPPIVKIVNKSEEYSRKRQEQEQAKLSKAKQSRKEVQLTWAIAEADAVHKLEKAREELEKGNRVDLVFSQKRGHPVPSEREMRERMQTVVDSLADVGKEWKEKDFQWRMAVAFLQGTEPTRSQEKTAAQDPDDAVLTKKRKYNVNPIPQEIWDLFK